jgi:phosphotransferase system  glucose/maltose/N-acetylglucosamine-specific IIC component
MLCGAGFVEYFKQLAIPFVISALAAAAGFAVATLFELAVLRLSTGLIVGGLVYLGLLPLQSCSWGKCAALNCLLKLGLSKTECIDMK